MLGCGIEHKITLVSHLVQFGSPEIVIGISNAVGNDCYIVFVQGESLGCLTVSLNPALEVPGYVGLEALVRGACAEQVIKRIRPVNEDERIGQFHTAYVLRAIQNIRLSGSLLMLRIRSNLSGFRSFAREKQSGHRQ